MANFYWRIFASIYKQQANNNAASNRTIELLLGIVSHVFQLSNSLSLLFVPRLELIQGEKKCSYKMLGYARICNIKCNAQLLHKITWETGRFFWALQFFWFFPLSLFLFCFTMSSSSAIFGISCTSFLYSSKVIHTICDSDCVSWHSFSSSSRASYAY